MYNKSYKGYNKHKFMRGSYSRVGRISKPKKEIGIKHLQIIRFVCVFLAVAITLTGIVIGFVIYSSGMSRPTESTIKGEQTDNREELLYVVNKNNSLTEDYIPQLTEYEDYAVNSIATFDLEKLLADATSADVDISVNYAYVSFEEQEKKYTKEYIRLLNDENLSQVTAEAKAQATVPQAGKSEYQTGLLINFKCSGKALKWLQRYCVDYGFVQRYTADKKGITGMNEDLNAYRYVGVEDAKMMRTLDMCLNEYAQYINIQQG